MNAFFGYITSLDRSSRKVAGFDTLELFGEKYLSAYQIWSNLKPTRLKMAYKNIHKRISALFSLGLIKETKVVGISNKRRTKYYRLTEYGIYHLFLKKLNLLLLNQPYLRQDKHTAHEDASFLQNYRDSVLFKIFMYPYFKKETLLAIGPAILHDLYRYLS